MAPRGGPRVPWSVCGPVRGWLQETEQPPAAAASTWDGDQAPENGDLCELPQVKVWDELKLTKLLRVKMAFLEGFWGKTIGSEQLVVGEEALPSQVLSPPLLRSHRVSGFQHLSRSHVCAVSLIIGAPRSPQAFMPRPPAALPGAEQGRSSEHGVG